MENEVGTVCASLMVCFFIFVGISKVIIFRRIERNGIETVGVIVDKSDEKDAKGNTIWKIKIRIEIYDGSFVEGFAKNAFMNSSRDYLGDEIPVIYNQNNPDEFVINRIKEKILNPLAWILAGLSISIAWMHWVVKLF